MPLKTRFRLFPPAPLASAMIVLSGTVRPASSWIRSR
jgi:hypothetical protein